MSRHERLLEKMRLSRAGWKPRDFQALYTGYGFEESAGAKHTKYRHPDYPWLWTMVKRADPLAKTYADVAVALIEELRRLESTE